MIEERRQGASLDDVPSKDLKDSPDLSQAIADYTRLQKCHSYPLVQWLQVFLPGR